MDEEIYTIKCPNCDHTTGRKNNRGEVRCNACWAVAKEVKGEAKPAEAVRLSAHVEAKGAPAPAKKDTK